MHSLHRGLTGVPLWHPQFPAIPHNWIPPVLTQQYACFGNEWYSRKRAVMFGYIASIVLGLVSAWLPILSIILVARFCLGALQTFWNSSLILLIEVMEPKRRTFAAFGINTVWGVTLILYGGLGYLIRDWRILQTAATLPGLLILPALWLIDESPLWLIVNGRPQEALQVFGKVARWHGVDLPPEAEMKKLVEEQAAESQNTNPKRSSMGSLLKSFVDDVVILLKTPRLRTITLIIYFIYIVVAMVYYGLSLSGASISDDPYLYLVLSGLMELPAYIFSGFIVQHFGRKSSLSFSFLITTAVLLAVAFTPAEYSTTLLALAMVGKMTITASYQMIVFFSSELFPTEVRSRGVSTAVMMSCLGSMGAPFITDLVGSMYPWAPFVIFGSGALLAAAGTFLLPETQGQVLPDTVAHLEARERRCVAVFIFFLFSVSPSLSQSTLYRMSLSTLFLLCYHEDGMFSLCLFILLCFIIN
ncbi:Organic cation transporter protein [Chionoecetes opilio]|uniref:Organic cation transporter protein n=1 Tax=Chionoecetes opilio TaxID=41210 RepID=A0A8J5BY33_CHIOP|nr:Organic cation transporter protein [Chionoecetes opilio]